MTDGDVQVDFRTQDKNAFQGGATSGGEQRAGWEIGFKSSTKVPTNNLVNSKIIYTFNSFGIYTGSFDDNNPPVLTLPP